MFEYAKIDKDFMSCGLRCIIITTYVGHHCAYVQVLSNHPAAYKNYDSIGNPDVHGGLNYARQDNQSAAWWFGFDFAHCDDWNIFNFSGHKWTIPEVENECRKLAEYLSTYTGAS